MENQTRLKIKVGEHLFEAEGSSEDVKEQYRLFIELVNSAPPITSAPPQPQAQQGYTMIDTLPTAEPAPFNDGALSKIMKQEGRVISLTVRAKSLEDAILLLMLGQKVFRNSEYTTGAEILDGLKTTGGLAVNRIDRLMEKIADDGHVIVTGERRGKKYRMTNSGVAKARQIAQELLAVVA